MNRSKLKLASPFLFIIFYWNITLAGPCEQIGIEGNRQFCMAFQLGLKGDCQTSSGEEMDKGMIEICEVVKVGLGPQEEDCQKLEFSLYPICSGIKSGLMGTCTQSNFADEKEKEYCLGFLQGLEDLTCPNEHFIGRDGNEFCQKMQKLPSEIIGQIQGKVHYQLPQEYLDLERVFSSSCQEEETVVLKKFKEDQKKRMQLFKLKVGPFYGPTQAKHIPDKYISGKPADELLPYKKILSLFGDKDQVVNLLMELEEEVFVMGLKHGVGPEIALQRVLKAWEEKNGFSSAIFLEKKVYSAQEWYDLLGSGSLFVDTEFFKKTHGAETHRIQWNLVMRALDKNPQNFGLLEKDKFQVVNLYKNISKLSLEQQLDWATTGLARYERKTIWDQVFDNTLLVGNVTSPEFLHPLLKDYFPFLGQVR